MSGPFHFVVSAMAACRVAPRAAGRAPREVASRARRADRVFIVASAIGLAWVLAGPTAASSTAAPPQFSSGVNLVEVYASVTDRQGAPVTGLQAGDFDVLEDGRPQKIAAFAAGDFPLSLGLAIDHSASMAGPRLPMVRRAARIFLQQLRPVDQTMILGISGEVEILAPLSTDRAAQGRVIDALEPWSTTSLYDAIVDGIRLVQPGRGRRALIVLSDGEDRYSRARPEDVMAAARRANVLVYPLAIGRTLPPIFPELAVVTGGQSFHVKDAARLQQVLSGIARDLRFQYLLGYEPSHSGTAADENGWHSIAVHVSRPGVTVRARDGYYGG